MPALQKLGSAFTSTAALATLVACAVLPIAAVAAPHMAMAYQGFSLKGALGDASDSALNKLSQPDAFYDDETVRVRLPEPLRNASKVLRFVGKSGLANDLTKSVNAAAGLAAQEAKPIFRAAIDDLSLSDGVGIATGGDRAATEYLRDTSGEVLREKVRPLVMSALGDVGAFEQLDKLKDVRQIASLAGADISNEGLADSVTDQAMDGIFSYIGNEEAAFRANPIEKSKGLLGGLLGN